MDSLKFCERRVLIPDFLISFADSKPGIVFCNLRVKQRLDPASEDETCFILDTCFTDGFEMHYPVVKFLKGIVTPILTAIAYQKDGGELYTMVRPLAKVERWEGGLPLLSFEKPSNWDFHEELWGSFIIALAQVDWAPTELMSTREDPELRNFMEIVASKGIPTRVPDRLR